MSNSTTLKKSLPWLFFVAMIGQMVGGALYMTYLVFYITDRMLISAAAMGAVMLLTRIADLIVGLFVGPFLQRFCGKFGQFRSWLLYAPLLAFVGVIPCFLNPAIPAGVKLVLVFVGNLLFGTGMSLNQLSQNGIMAKIAGPDIPTRMTITGKIVQGQNAGMIITAMVTLPFIMLIDRPGVDGYTVVQIIYSIAAILMSLALFVGTKEYEKYDPTLKNAAGGGSAGLISMYTNTLKNSQLVILMLGDALRWLATMALASLVMYYFTYVVQNPGLMTVALTLQSFTGLLGAFVGVPVSKKVGKKNAALLTGAICAIAYAGIAFFTGANAIMYIVFNSLATFGMSFVNACGVNLFLDAAEYQLYRTGKDNRTVAMSMYGIPIKVGIALSSIIVALTLNAAGYDGVAKTVANTNTMMLLLGGIPALCFALYFVLMSMYKITEEKSREYAEHNHKNAGISA